MQSCKLKKIIKRLLIFLLPIQLFGQWTFTQKDFDSLTESQMVILKQSYHIGKQDDLQLTLPSIAIVETRIGKYQRDTTKICGVHQIAMYTARERLKQFDSNEILCKLVLDYPSLSAFLALLELKYWKSVYPNQWSKQIMAYNGGWDVSKHGKEFLRRVRTVINILKKNESKLKIVPWDGQKSIKKKYSICNILY